MATPVEVKTGVLQPSYTFTRPGDTTAYAAGDLVANNTAAASVVPMTWKIGPPHPSAQTKFYLPGIRLRSSKATVTAASFRIHLYKALPTFTSAGDNGVFATVVATGAADWLASYDVTFPNVQADGANGIAAPTAGIIPPHIVAGGVVGSETTIWGLIEARDAYSPANAGTFTAELLLETN